MSSTTTLARLVRMPREQLLGQLARALRIDDADDRQDEQALADLEHRRRQLADRLLLLADDALALLHEADGHGGRDAVGGRLVRVQDAVQLVEVLVVGREQRARASTSRRRSTMPTTSCVSTPRGMMRSERLRA